MNTFAERPEQKRHYRTCPICEAEETTHTVCVEARRKNDKREGTKSRNLCESCAVEVFERLAEVLP